MKRCALMLALLVMVLTACDGNTGTQSNLEPYEEAMALYEDFLNGKISAVDSDKEFHISEMYYDREFEFGVSPFGAADKYALFDMNGDGIPELHIRSGYKYDIITYYNGELRLFHDGSVYEWPLNNSTLLHKYHTTGIRYEYKVLDFWGNDQLNVDFDVIYVSETVTKYYFMRTEVSEEVWEALTEPFLTVPQDLIIWEPMSERI